MFNSTYLDVAIGLIFIFLLLSLLVTTINEIIAGAMRMRARMLRKAIYYMLSDKNGKEFAAKVYNHPLVNNPVDADIIPSYIGAKNFSKIMLDIFSKGDGCGSLAKQFETSVNELSAGAVKDSLAALVKNAEGNIDKLREQIEHWFDFSMDRVTGWYKRKMQAITFVVGLSLCVVFNANTFSIIHNLVYDKDSREEMVAMAENYVQNHKPYVDSLLTHSRMKTDTAGKIIPNPEADSAMVELKKIKELGNNAYDIINDLNKTNNFVGMGWGYAWQHDYSPAINGKCGINFCSLLWVSFLNLIGILITSLALLLGAPFWFDMLNKIISIRNSGKKPDESVDKK